ncbi:MAG: hypothetical protein KF889_05830 [Alphaproteobacteria bacterium]|nr:hypothetical protein [Alphaproteobacteria bacterium]MCW5742390.1 hypothetical protein [Alphaproteobacteria bacterium]
MLASLTRPTQLLLSIALLLAFAAGMAMAIVAVVEACDGRLISWLDDAYIHMAIARSLAEHSVYGLTPGAFTSASSSPLWVLALSMTYSLFGVGESVAFVLNILAAIGLLLIAAEQLSRPADSAVSLANAQRGTRWQTVGGRWRVSWAIAGAVALMLATAPIALVLGAMEHVAHAALMLIGVDAVARRLSDADELASGIALYLTLLALPLLRYESLWLGGLAVLGGLATRQWLFALAALLATAVGPYVFGALAMSEGWWMLPTPILVKSGLGDLLAQGSAWAFAKYLLWYPLKRLVAYVPLLAALMAVAAVVLVWALARDRENARRAWWIALALSLAGAWIHATFGHFGWGGRYEAYLLALFCVYLPVALAHLEPPARPFSRRGTILALAAAALAGGLLVHRGVVMHRDPGPAAATVWQRDFWPADFIEETQSGSAVMAMNIGALMWRAAPELTDILALGDREAAALVLARRLDNEAVRALARRREVKLAILFDDYYAQWVGGPPPFTRIATGRPVASPDAAFSIYVTDPADARRIAADLRRFAAAHPNRVTLEFEDGR